MKKINRRDYLLRMGSGAAGIIGASQLNVFGQKTGGRSTNVRRRAPIRNLQTGGVLKWPVTNTLPSRTPFVTGFFAGLIGFCYDDTNSGDRFVDVGFHPGGGRHEFKIQIFRLRNSRCEQPPKVYTPRSRSLEFGLRPPGPGPNVFQTPGAFDRNRTGTPYDFDFRWLPDIDSADFYPENYPKNARYPIRLKVTDGTFYTRMHTTSTFKLVDADRQDCETEIRDFGHVAQYMAVAIDTQSTVFLTEAEPLQWEQGVSYHVVFANECERCSYDVNDCNEAARNDFHFNRKVVRVPNNRFKYGLRLKQGCGSGQCPEPDFCYERPHGISDEAPCMGSAFGQTSGFP